MADAVGCKLCNKTGLEFGIGPTSCTVCSGYGRRPKDPLRTERCSLCKGNRSRILRCKVDTIHYAWSIFDP